MSRFSRGRATSPYEDNVFATATETSFQEQDLLHSTPQRDAFPLHYDQHPSPLRPRGQGDDQDTLSSAEMSIELGRGVKRAQHDFADMSSNAVFSFEHTPPLQSHSNNQRQPESALRKQASVRRATASARANDALKRTTTPRSVSETLPRRLAENDPVQSTATFTLRGSRFAGVRQVSSQYNVPRHYSADGGLEQSSKTPRRTTAGHPTLQSATYTSGQSFMLPDLPNITELVSGRDEGTPLMKRTTMSRTRFVSGTHRAVNSLSVPQDDQAIFASLQVLGDRVAQLELEKIKAQKHVEEYEHEVIELKAQLGGPRPDSGIGSEDDDTARLARSDKARLQTKITAAEERLHRSERKLSVSEITVARVSKERDHVIQQLASAFFANEELETANQAFRSSINDVLAENDDLKARLQSLTEQNAHLRAAGEGQRTTQPEDTSIPSGASRRRRSGSDAKHENIAEGLTINSTVHSRMISHDLPERTCGSSSSSQLNDTAKQSLASRVQHEFDRQRAAALSTARKSHDGRENTCQYSRARSQHKARPGMNEDPARSERAASRTVHRRNRCFTAEATDQSQQSFKYVQKFEEDLTQLTDIDPIDVASLRRKLENEMRARHIKQQDRAQSEPNLTERSTMQHIMTRKSSMRDVTAGAIDGIVQSDHTKTVRVQSPHTADEISHSGQDDASSLGNVNRRQRHFSASEGLTSAFIIPDITVAVASAPAPVPVTDRPTYSSDASNITLRPSQSPVLALSSVIRHLENEISQLKAKRDIENKAYNSHDPALARRVRIACVDKIDALTVRIEEKSDQVYALYDVLEAHKGEVALKKQTATSRDAGDAGDESELGFEGFSEIGDSEDESREVRI